MGSAEWVPAGTDVEQPSSARIYDYWLGGAHNFAVDRQIAEQMIAAYPDVPRMAWANRAFLRRAVEYLVGAGIRQFLDIGSGIPTVGHVHEIAQTAAPDSRVVFVDIDPVAVAHSRQILTGNDRTAVIQEDFRQPEQILEHPELRQLLDLTQPVAVLVFALLHFVPEADDPADVLARLTEPLVSGSYLALSHGTDDGRHEEAAGAKAILQRGGITQTLRTRAEVEALFAGLDLVDPGVVWVPQWHPESLDDVYHDRPEASGLYGGVARKR
jgi:SAM-dependent methyltransferase